MSGILIRATKLIAKAGAALGLAVSMAPAQADVWNFYWKNGGGNSFLVATVTTSGTTDFRVDFVYAPATGDTAKLNDLQFNGPNASFLNLSGDTAPDASACYTSQQGCNPSSGADWLVSWPTSGNSKFTEGEFSLFRIYTTQPSQWSMEELHINAFLNGDSIKLDGCKSSDTTCTPPQICEPDGSDRGTVPEPVTLALLGSGIAGLALMRRRRRS